MKPALAIGLFLLTLSMVACSTSSVATAPNSVHVAPFALQSNSPSVQWEFPMGIPEMEPVAGNDGHIWGAASANQSIVVDRLDPRTFRFQQFSQPFPNIEGLTLGPGGQIWFCFADEVAAISTSGTVTTFTAPNSGTACRWITGGPDGNIWISDVGLNQIVRVTPTGTFTSFSLPNPSNQVGPIIGGKNGLVWFEEFNPTTIYVSAINTNSGAISEFALPGTANQHHPDGLVTGSDGNAYALDGAAITRIYKVTSAGVVRGFRVPTVFSETQSAQRGVRTIWLGTSDGLAGWSTTSHQATFYGFPPSPPPQGGPQDFPSLGPDGNIWMVGGVFIRRLLLVVPQSATIDVGNSQSFAVTESNCSGCSWTAKSSNLSVATVSMVTNGQFTVTGVAVGTATVTVSDRHENVVQVPISVQ